MKNHFVDVLPPNHYNLFIDFMMWFQMCTCCHSNFSCAESGLNIISVCFSLCRSFVIDLKVKLVLTNVYLKKSCDHKIYEIAYKYNILYTVRDFCVKLHVLLKQVTVQ